MITIRKINDDIVKPVPIEGGSDPRPILGAELFPELYANIFLCAKKNSGKTSAVFHILKKCVGKDTDLVIFCSTIHKDPTWISIIKYFKNKGNNVEAHTSLKDGGIDLLDELINSLQEEAEAEQEEPEEIDPKELLKQKGGKAAMDIYNWNTTPQTGYGEKKPRKPKYRAPEIILVLDDLSTELKSKSLVGLLKKNRHFKMKIIISSQWVLDMLPESRKQIDFWLLFKGQTETKLETIYRDSDISISYELFEKLYRNATAKPYQFLYLNTRQDEFRQSFNKAYDLSQINS